MIVFKSEDYEDITILGHALHYEGIFCDLRDENVLVVIAGYCPGWDCKPANKKSFLSDFFKESLLKKLPRMSNWGNAEQDYQAALDSGDYIQKGLLAINGKYRDILANDESDSVRYLVASGIVNDKKRGVVTNDALGLMEAFVSGEQSERYMVAEFGHKAHLDLLVNDSAEHVRRLVASHSHKDHLDVLESDEDSMVRRWVAMSRRSVELDGSDEILSQDEDILVRLEVARRGDASTLLSKDSCWQVRKAVAIYADANLAVLSELARDPIAAIRCQVASRGIELDLLVLDEDEYVRADVAKQGRIKDLVVLMNDPSRIVRLEVAKYGYGLAHLINDEEEEIHMLATSYPVNVKRLFKALQ